MVVSSSVTSRKKMRTVTRNSPSILLVLALSGCSLAPPSSDSFTISSEPPGADVFVFGEKVGTTPVDIAVAQVFPNTFAAEQETLYGRVVLRKEGCTEQTVPVGTKVVARGMKVKLDCGKPAATAAPASLPVPAPAEQNDVAARLQRLKALRDDGTITADEYDAHRRRILESL
jgi:hypothetical protein